MAMKCHKTKGLLVFCGHRGCHPKVTLLIVLQPWGLGSWPPVGWAHSPFRSYGFRVRSVWSQFRVMRLVKAFSRGFWGKNTIMTLETASRNDFVSFWLWTKQHVVLNLHQQPPCVHKGTNLTNSGQESGKTEQGLGPWWHHCVSS